MELSIDPSLRAQAYRAGDPFPHAVLDGLFPAAVLDEVLAEFPGPGTLDWHRFNNDRERKLGMKTGDGLPSRTLGFLHFLNSAPMVRFLETLTGIQGLVPDPYYEGGGLHQILPGGYLKIHADFNWHHRLKLHRRINMLIYLNKDWKEEYGAISSSGTPAWKPAGNGFRPSSAGWWCSTPPTSPTMATPIPWPARRA